MTSERDKWFTTLCEERSKLMHKKLFDDGLNTSETQRLSWINKELERIEEEVLGPSLRLLEAHADILEDLADEVKEVLDEFVEIQNEPDSQTVKKPDGKETP